MGKFKGKPNRLGEVSLIGLPSHFGVFAGGGATCKWKKMTGMAQMHSQMLLFHCRDFMWSAPPQPPLCSVRSSMCLWSVIDNVAQAALPNPAYWSMKQPEKVAR